MKRLNGVLSVLLDTEGRERYDRSLAALAIAVSSERPLEFPQPRSLRTAAPAAIAGAAVLLLLLLVLWPPRPPAIVPALPRVAGAIPASESQLSRHVPRQRNRAAKTLEDLEWAPLATYAYETHIAIPPIPFSEQPTLPEASLAAAESPAIQQSAPPLAGDWLFVPASSVHSVGYPPDYIELHLRQEGDLIHGRYQARYLVTDHAISPNVTFVFEGQLGAEGGTLPWHGQSGAKGEVTLRPLPGGDLEVRWEASQLGTELGLISGTATLMRKPESP